MTTTNPHRKATEQVRREITEHMTALSSGTATVGDIDADELVARIAGVDGWRVAHDLIEHLTPSPSAQWWGSPLGVLCSEALARTPGHADLPGVTPAMIGAILGVKLPTVQSAIRSQASGLKVIDSSGRPWRYEVSSVHRYAAGIRKRRSDLGRSRITGKKEVS